MNKKICVFFSSLVYLKAFLKNNNNLKKIFKLKLFFFFFSNLLFDHRSYSLNFPIGWISTGAGMRSLFV